MDFDPLRITFNIVSIGVTASTFYYALRLTLLFRTGELEKPWRIIALGIVLISLANMVFLFRNALFSEVM